ncbi:hypothetical protein [Erwinia phage vB_EamM-EAP4]|nr:hypothetical protein [Erwinia phage vB_EamM-EAP4]
MGYGMDDEVWDYADEIAEEERQERWENTERTRNKMKVRYNRAKTAETGATIACPFCGKLIVKRTYHKIFCSNAKTHGKVNCKDRFWNFADENRCFRAQLMGK